MRESNARILIDIHVPKDCVMCHGIVIMMEYITLCACVFRPDLPVALEREESVSLYEKTAKRHQMTDREGGREGDFEREEDIKKDGLREREGGFREMMLLFITRGTEVIVPKP